MSLDFANSSNCFTASLAISTDTTTVTQMCWAYIPDTTDVGCLASIGSSNTTEGGYSFGYGSNNFDTNGASDIIGLLGGTEWQDTNYPIVTGSFSHITQVRDGSNNWKYYLNGVDVGYSSGTNPLTIQAATVIGASEPDGTRGCNARICQYKMWSSALTVAQIINEMRSPTPVHNFDTLVAYLPFEQYDTVPASFLDTVGKVTFSKVGTVIGGHHTHF